MREVTIRRVNITDVWINAYYTSFSCYQCHSRGDTKDNRVVFHHTRYIVTPSNSRHCLCLTYTPYELVQVVNCSAECCGIDVTIHQLHQKR